MPCISIFAGIDSYEMESWIGVDIGTTNTKAVVFDEAGRVLAHHSVGYDMIHPEPDYSEQDPEAIWEAVKTVLEAVSGGLTDIRAVSFSAAMHSLLPVDAAGNPLGNLVIWADNRAKAEAQELRDSEAGRAIFRVCGTPLHPMTPLCKLMWWSRHQPEVIQRSYKFVGIKEFIWFRLTGEWAIDYSLASATGMFDISTFAWHAPALETAGIPEAKLSPPVSPYHRAEAAGGAGLPAGTPLIIGASDGCLANLGTGAIVPGRLAITIGTSGAVRVCSPDAATDPLMRTFTYVLDEGTYIVGGGTNSGGVILQWIAEQLFPGIPTDELITHAAAIEPGADGLIFLPYLLGERAPLWDANARGGFFGLTLQHTPTHLVRAVLEGICLHTCSLVRILEEQGPVNEIFASGGFARSPEWVQLLADCAGKPVRLPETVEAGAWGAVLLAMKQAGRDHLKWLEGLQITRTFEPDPTRAELYKRLGERQLKLYEVTKELETL
ncbi:MAG: gluconokinase [Siphonobacter aquaeclarae]|nr:gluconokinase [Siphonobacter aquaeclarae]